MPLPKPTTLAQLIPLWLAMACISGVAPTVSTQSAQLLGAGPEGVQVRVSLLVYNPNDFDIRVDAISATVTLDGQTLGTQHATDLDWLLQAGQNTPVHADVVVPYRLAPNLLLTGMLSGTVPYEVAGEVSLGGVPFDLDYAYEGSVDRAFLLRSVGNSLGAP